MNGSWHVSEAWLRPGWAVRRTWTQRATRIFATKRGAINTARRWGKRDKVSVYLFNNLKVGDKRPQLELLYPDIRTLRRWLAAT